DKIHPEHKQMVDSSAEACISGKAKYFEEEFRFRCADEKYRWFRSRACITKVDEQGAPLEIFGFYNDINAEKLKELSLRENDMRWRQALSQATVGVWDWNIETGETYFSPEWSRMLGFDPTLTPPRIETWRKYAHPKDLARSDLALEAYLKGESDSYECECRVRTREGELIWVLDRGVIVERDVKGKPIRLVGTHYDITKQKEQSLEIEQSHDRLRSITSLVPGVVYQYQQFPDGRHCFPYASRGMRDIYFVSPEKVVDDATPIVRVIHPEDVRKVGESIQASAENRIPWNFDYRVRQPDDSYRWVRGIASVPKRQQDGSYLWSGYIQDVTALKESEIAEKNHRKELLHQSTHDELTGLPNRRLFMDRLEQRINNAKRDNTSFAVLMIDLDMFKSVNDTLGHQAGDDLLKEVGHRLCAQSRSADTISRLGGDEFAVILAGSDSVHAAVSFVNKLLEAFSNPMKLDQQKVPIKASIGIVMFPEHGNTAKEILGHADEAMYSSKQLNIPFRVYSSGKDTKIHANAKLSLEIAGLVESNQVQLVYQPKFCLETNKIVGVEALARWQHPTLGQILPARFIPIVERSKYCYAFSMLAMDKALSQARRWHDSGNIMPVSVNISPQTVTRAEFSDAMMNLLHKYQLEPDDLILEITETASFLDFERAMNVLREIAQAGVGISIDDFGMGYTSIRYLRDFPARELKIDKSFIERILEEKRYFSIVKSMVELAKGIGANTVAEGIETAEILESLSGIKCDYGQGYYLAKPMRSYHVFELIKKTAHSEAAHAP
ncbi:MAG: EAL domain-containing protein, partial [Pseudomonadota bacterium]